MIVRISAFAFIASVLCACAGTDSGPGGSRFTIPGQPGVRSHHTTRADATPSPIAAPASVNIPAVGAVVTMLASETGVTLTAISSNINIVTVSPSGGACAKIRRPVRRKPHTMSGDCFSLTGIATGTATVTLSDGLGNSVDVAVRVQTPILVSVPPTVVLQGPGDTLTFTAGVNAPAVQLSAVSNDSTIVSVATGAAGARHRQPRNPEAVMTTNQRFTLTCVTAGGATWVTISSPDPKYSPTIITALCEDYTESFTPGILLLNQGESGYVLPFSDSFDESVTSVTSSAPAKMKVTRPFAHSPIFNVTGTLPIIAGQITIASNKGSYPSTYAAVQPISTSSDNLTFASSGQGLAVTVSEKANTTFTATAYDPDVASVSPGSATSGATSTATFNVTSLTQGQTYLYVTDTLGYQAFVSVMVGPAFTVTPSALAFTAVGQQQAITVNYPPNPENWTASAASSNTSVVEVAYNRGQFWAMAVAPGKATIYVRNTDGNSAGLGEMISIPVDVTATGGVIH